MKELFYAKSENGELVFSNKKALKDFVEKHKDKTFIVTIQRETGVRSDNQNRALHKWFSLVADELNGAGWTVQKVMQNAIELDWNDKLVKEMLWRPAQKALLGKESTTELNKASDIDEIWEPLNRYLGEKYFIHVPFPDDPTN